MLHCHWPWVTWLLLSWTLSTQGNVNRELVLDVFENIPEGTLIGTITGPSPPYLIVGTDTTDLVIDQSNGEIRTKVKLDREVRDLYSFVAIPLNGEGVRVSIRVTDTNDNAPTFASAVMSVEFPENTPRDVKRTLQPARDKDLGVFNTQRYVISGGNVNNAFRLASHRERDGVLYLDLQVNGFLDRETTPFYNLVIDAYDGGIPPLKGSMTVHVTLTDVNDNSPIFNQSRYFATISENVTTGTSVLQVFATDTDAGVNGQVSYAINRRQTDKDNYFNVDPSSGVISVNRALDYETKEVHELVVIARDGGGIHALETTVFVSIRVLDVNDHQPIISLVFLTKEGGARVSEGANPGEFVARVSVSDPDGKVDYSGVTIKLISGGRGHFTLEKRNEALYLIVAAGAVIDREKFPEYAITLTATDPSNPTLNTSITVRIRVDDVNDNEPSFSDSEFYASVDEVAETGTSVIQVVATDRDEGQNSAVRYSLTPVDGSHSDWFRIDPLTGVIVTQAAVDCETESTPRVTVVATDGGNPPLSSTATVFIQVRDVNDNEPVFDQSFYNVSVPEDAPSGRCILKVSATDPDCGINAVVTYKIRESNLRAQLPWTLNASTGELCVSAPLDYEERNLFEFSVIAADAGGLSSTAVVRIQLLDVNDNDPKFFPTIYETTIPEEHGQGTHVVTVKAVDADTVKSALTYRIVRGNEGHHFDINPDLGIITLRHRIPIQSEPTRVLQRELTVEATDAGGRSSEAKVLVNLSGPNSHGPQFGQGRYTFKISEDAPINAILGLVSASSSSRAKGKVRYSISSGDPNNYFKMDALRGEIATANTLDHEKVDIVLLHVVANEENSPGFSHAQVEIQILDVNDNSPEFESSVLNIWVAESAEVRSIIYSVRATDRDDGDFGRIVYRFLDGHSALFDLNAQTGDIRLLQSLDFERVKKHELVIGGVDHGNPPKSSNCTLIIEVQDVNDNSPKFTESGGYSITVPESMPINSQLIEIHAEDKDTGNNGRITYNLSGNTYEGLFEIFPASGILTLKGPLDRETSDKYLLSVVALDHGIPPLSATTTLLITVQDENDNDPVFEKDFYKFSIDENRSVGSYVGEVRAGDMDIGDNGALRYFVQEQGLQPPFEIDGISGIITTTVGLDREKTALHELQVVAHDLGHPQRQAEVIVHVQVNDINDCSPRIVEPEDDRLLVREEQPEGTELTKIMAMDADNGHNGTVVYALLNDDDFTIERESGVIRTKHSLKYDLRSTYTFNVIARDLGVPPRETLQEYHVEVLELDDTFHQIQGRSRFTFEVSEASPIGHIVGSLQRNDDTEARLIFDLVHANTSDGTFELDKRSGKIYLGKQLDYEVTSEYSLQVRVIEASGATLGIRHVSIIVTDENDEAPTFAENLVSIHVPEDTPIGTAICSLSAIDLDGGVNGLVHYSLTLQQPIQKFRINTLTGRIYVQETLDYESESTYFLVVTATDQALDHNKRLSTSITLHVSIDDVNDNAPRFVSNSKIYIVKSARHGSWIHTVIAVDDDSGVNGQITYTVTNAREAIFKIHPQSGQLTLLKPFPAESRTYTLNISATDGGTPPKNAFQELIVTVDEANRSPPRFGKLQYFAKVQENSLKGTPVVKVGIVSKDSRPNNTVLYVLPEASSDGRFGIQPSSGFISLNSPLDRESESEFNLTVFAIDTNMDSLYDTSTVFVKVLDANDNAPRLVCPTLTVPENQELGIIHTFSAADPDSGRGGEVTYSIAQGNPENIFSIDLHGGQLKSRPLDRERRASYTLVLAAQDQGLPVHRSSCNVTISVLDENDNSPQFTQKEYRATLSEDSPLGTTVLVVEATDADIGLNAAISYSANNVTSSHFRIDEKSGAILVAGKLDRERIGEYLFEVVATDGGIYDSRSSKARVSIIVTDVNDNRPLFTSPSFQTLDVSPNTKPGTVVGQILATDQDSGVNGDVTYALESSTNKFRLHPRTGVLTVGDNLESESGRSVNLKIIAKDQGHPPLTATAIVQISVGQVPVVSMIRFTETKYRSKISENSPPGKDVVRVTALRNDGRRQAMKYEIVGGNEEYGFEVTANSGQIRVKNSTVLDRERRESFTLLLSGQPDNGNSPFTAFTLVVINLIDENDSSPVFNQDIYTVAVWEGNSKGAFVIQVTATDDDAGPNGQLLYYIVDGNEDNAFVIEPPNSGLVKTNIVLDREIQEEYRLTVMATDDGNPQMSGSCLLRIRVIDLNDNIPTFPPVSDVSVSEAAGIGTLVTTLSANDVDVHPDLSYSFESNGNPGGLFSLGKYDGRIWLMKELDYEQEKSHALTVRVSDSVHEAVAQLKINVLDANDNPPRFSKDVYEAAIPGQIEGGTEIVQVSATDADTPLANGFGIKYSLSVPSIGKSRAVGSKLRIDESNGKIYTNDSFDAEIKPGFVEFTVIARDSGTPSLASKVTLWLHISTNQDELVKFSTDKYSIEVPQNTSVGNVIFKLDTKNKRQRNQDTQAMYAITSGNADNVFMIEGHSGNLHLAKRLTMHSPPEYSLTVTATCEGMNCGDNTTVGITVSPSCYLLTFSQSKYSISIPERKPIGSTIYKFEPLKMPPGLGTVTYTMTSGSSESSKQFELNKLTGAITLKEPLNYGRSQIYKLLVLARTECSRILVPLEFLVEDANDHAPIFLLSSYLEFVSENEPIGTPVFTARAIDPDGIGYGNLTYSILETSANQKFQIDASTGLVTTATVFDYETLNRFHFTLRVADGGGLATSVKVQVEVTSRDEYIPAFRQKAYRWTIPSNAEAGYVAGTVRATDEDQGVDGFVFYRIATHSDHFKINRTSGTVILRERLHSNINTSMLIVASSGQHDSKSNSVSVQVNIGPPSTELGTAGSVTGLSEWLIGLLVTVFLLVLTVSVIALLCFLRHKARRKQESPTRKMDLSYTGTGNFDSLAYTAHSTMLAGATSQPASIYSPQYSDLAELGRRRNPGSELSDKSHNSASSGRGSAEEDDDDEIRMINEGRLREQKLRESLGMLPESALQDDDEDSVKNTQEYLARLGIRPILEDAESGGSQIGQGHVPCDEIPFDISLIYSQIPDADECDHVEARQGQDETNLSQRHPGAEAQPGSYNWDYLQHWGPQYQPLAHVFSEIARLNEDVASGHYSGLLGELGHSQSDKGHASSCNNSTSGKSDSSRSTAHKVGSSHGGRKKASAFRHNNAQMSPNPGNLPLRGPLPALPIVPRSPITADLSYSSPLSPSFSPELSFCNSLPILPEHNVGIRTAVYPNASYASSESSEMRI